VAFSLPNSRDGGEMGPSTIVRAPCRWMDIAELPNFLFGVALSGAIALAVVPAHEHTLDPRCRVPLYGVNVSPRASGARTAFSARRLVVIAR
jgi:hypothetical protein